MRVIYHPDAEAETIEAALYYESQRGGLGGEFLHAIDAAVKSVLRDPLRLPVVGGDVRRQFVHRFPYEIYFRTIPDELRILAVKHHRRNPGYWTARH